MITSAFIQQLKQSNISKDGEKTSTRVHKIWKAATAEQKAAACELSGSAKATIYRISKTGGISAKLALALGKALHVDPMYLTGEIDESGEYTEADAIAFLVRLGYNKLLVEQEKALRRAQREAERQQQETEAAAQAGEQPAPPAQEAPLPAAHEAPVNEIVTNEDVLALLRALEIRAKAGVPDAKELLRQMKLLLLAA